MSWQERLRNTTFKITTGDGIVWTPKWQPRGKSLEFNNSIYNYPQLKGSFVDRREAKGDKYNFDIMFDGDDNVDKGESFLVSSKDKRAWKIVHPFYGNLTVQPVRLAIDNSNYNVFGIKIECIDTVITDQSDIIKTPDSVVNDLKTQIDDNIDVSYETDIITPEVEDINHLQNTVTVWDNIYSKTITAADDLSEFKRNVVDAQSKVNDLITNVQAGIRSVTNLINFPSRVQDSLSTRFNSLSETFDEFRNTITRGATLDPVLDPIPPSTSTDVSIVTPKEKVAYMSNGAAIVSSAAFISIIQPEPIDEDNGYNLRDDYPSRADLLAQIDRLNKMYSDFITTLDVITTERADLEDSFIPDSALLFKLENIITATLRNLESQIKETAQERTVVLPDNSDIINITHRYLGLDTNDENIDKIIDVNKLSLNDMLELKKGRIIKYYV